MRHVRIFAIEDDGKSVMEIGDGTYEQINDGSLDFKLTLVGDCTMSSNNISGLTRLRQFILASLRKD